MAHCARIATLLDVEMFKAGQILLDEGHVLDMSSPRPGHEVSRELNGRCVLRYLRRHQVGKFAYGTDDPQCVTPTAYTPRDAVQWLALPSPLDPPSFVLFIDIASVPKVLGPRRVRLGGGIEYVLPEGFPAQAVIHPGWEIEIR